MAEIVHRVEGVSWAELKSEGVSWAELKSEGVSVGGVRGHSHIASFARSSSLFKCRRVVCALIMEATRSRCDALVFSMRVRAASR